MAKTAKTTVLTFAALTAMAPAELFKRLTEKVKVHESIDKAKAKVVENLKEFAKEVAAFKRLYTERYEKHEIPGDTSFKKYWKDNVGGKLPGRAESLAALFNTLVLMVDANGKPMLAEKHYDAAKAAWLETANANIAFARKAHGDNWRFSDDVIDTINALSEPGDAQEALDEIRKRQKGEKETDGDEKAAVTVTPALAAQYLIAAIKNAAKASAEEQFTLFQLSVDVSAAWDESGLDHEVLNGFADRLQNAAKHGVASHMEVITSETPDTVAA